MSDTNFIYDFIKEDINAGGRFEGKKFTQDFLLNLTVTYT